MAEQTRASLFAIKEESTTGSLAKPTAGTDFIPLRSGGFNIDPQIESLTTNELVAGSLGASASVAGKESPTGTYNCYIKGTGTPNQSPLWALFLESLMGVKYDNATEYDTVSSSTTTVLKVNTGEGAQFKKGQAVMVKDTAAGRNYSIRNIESISGDDLTLNFALSNAPNSGVNLGKANLITPSTTHPSFSTWLYHANGAAVEAVAGARCSSATLNFPAGNFAEANFNYSGTKYYFDPIEVDASSRYIDFKDNGGGSELTATLSTGFYRPEELATEVDTRLEAVGGFNYGCSWNPLTGKFTLTTDTTTVDFLWATGTNNANSAKTILGFTTDSTAAATYTGTEKTWNTSLTPSYDVDGIANVVVKNAELFIGSQTSNICIKASEASVSIEGTITEITSLCSSSGVLEKPITGRAVTLTATTLLEKHRSDYINSLLTAGRLSAMLNVGQKDGAGNWIPGQCFNVYLGNANITQHVIGGDDYRTINITAKGYVTDTLEDVYINFI